MFFQKILLHIIYMHMCLCNITIIKIFCNNFFFWSQKPNNSRINTYTTIKHLIMQYYNVVENVPSTITVENPHLLIITNGLAQGLEQVRLQHVFR